MEAVLRKEKAEKRFADTMCEQIRYCSPWQDPIEREEELQQKAMEEIFE